MKHNQEKQQIQHILAMLEENPTDAGVLRYMDKLIYCAAYGKHGSRIVKDISGEYQDYSSAQLSRVNIPNYSTSIDAQKSLEVEGWRISIMQRVAGWECYIRKPIEPNIRSHYAITEPLARLHAWMQVRLWEIENG